MNYNQMLNKQKSFRQSFEAGDKIFLTELQKVGYVTRKTPDYIWTMYYDDTKDMCLGFMGFRYEGIELLEKVKTNKYKLSDKHYEWLKTTPLYDVEDKRFCYQHLQHNKAFEVNTSVQDITKKGFYNNKERLCLLVWICKETGKPITEFLNFTK